MKPTHIHHAASVILLALVVFHATSRLRFKLSSGRTPGVVSGVVTHQGWFHSAGRGTRVVIRDTAGRDVARC